MMPLASAGSPLGVVFPATNPQVAARGGSLRRALGGTVTGEHGIGRVKQGHSWSRRFACSD